MSVARRPLAAARDRRRAAARAAARRLGQPVPRVAAEQVARRALLQPYRDAAQAVQQGRGGRRATPRRCFALAPYIVFGCMVLAAAIVPSLSHRPAVRAGRRRDRAGRPVRAGARVHLARRDGHRHRLRHARRAARDAGRLPRRAGAADGALHRVADLASRPRCRRSSRRWRTASSRSIRASRSPASPSRWCSLAENARIPVDNPATHLELTMIHEAMILEYSARHLALIEWAAA